MRTCLSHACTCRLHVWCMCIAQGVVRVSLHIAFAIIYSVFVCWLDLVGPATKPHCLIINSLLRDRKIVLYMLAYVSTRLCMPLGAAIPGNGTASSRSQCLYCCLQCCCLVCTLHFILPYGHFIFKWTNI